MPASVKDRPLADSLDNDLAAGSSRFSLTSPTDANKWCIQVSGEDPFPQRHVIRCSVCSTRVAATQWLIVLHAV